MAAPEKPPISVGPYVMNRRHVLALGAATLGSAWLGVIGAVAQAPTHPLIAVLLGGSQATVERWLGGFPQELQTLGYVEHRDYEIEYRFGDGNLGRLPMLAADLASLHPDIIVVGNTAAALAAKRAGPSVPIIVAAATDPVRFGLAKDRARPGGNVTGMLAGLEGLAGKQLELGLQLLPGKTRVGMLVNTTNVASELHRQSAETASQARAVDLDWESISTADGIGKAMHELARKAVDYVIVPADAMFLNERRRIAELALSVKVPAVYAFREHAEAGGLISYGVDLREQFRHAARYADKIFKGAKPADLPFEQTTSFELVINAGAAKALGLTVPPSLLARADEVIE